MKKKNRNRRSQALRSDNPVRSRIESNLRRILPASGSEGTGDSKENDLLAGSKGVYGGVLELVLFVEVSHCTVR